MAPRRFSASLFVGLLGASACGDDCPAEHLPGVCEGRQTVVSFGHDYDDGVLLDLDNDGQAEMLGVVRGGLRVVWGDGRLLIPRGVGGSIASVELGDFDDDGRDDVALLTRSTARLHLAAVDDRGELTEIAAIELGGSPMGLRAGDLDGDGRVDLVTADRDGGALVLIHGDSRQHERILLEIAPGAFELGDLDGDGVLDVVVADFLSAQLLTLRGAGDGTFAASSVVPAVLGLSSIAVGDVDGDGAVDVATRGGGRELWVHLGDGAGGLDSAFMSDLVDAEGSDRGLAIMPPGDDGVGGVLAPETGGISTWLFGQDQASLGRARRSGGTRISPEGPGAWLVFGSTVERLEIAEGPLPVETWRRRVGDPLHERWGPGTIADHDGDGVLDVIAVHSAREPDTEDWSGAAEIFRGNGDGTFTPAEARPLGDVQTIVAGDFDGDGTTDVAGGVLGGEIVFSPASGTSAVALRLEDGSQPPPQRPLAALDIATRTLLAVAELHESENPLAELTALWIDGEGTVVDAQVLAPGVEILALRVADLDGDDDDDLLLVGRVDERRILQAWFVDVDSLVAGPIHDLGELTGWFEDARLTGLGIGALTADAEDELLLGSLMSLARIIDIGGPSPSVELDDAYLPAISITSPLGCCNDLPPLIVGELNGDDERDLIRCGDTCDVLFGEGGHVVGEPYEVSVPAGQVMPMQADGDGRTDFLTVDPAGIGVMLTATHAGPRATGSWPGLAATLSSLLAGDLDGDGRDEVVMPAAGGIAVFRDLGLPSRSTHALLGGPEPAVAAIADLDHDGRDEVVYGPTSLGLLGALRWDGAGLHVAPLSAPGLRAEHGLHAEDLDGDGVVDLIADRGTMLALSYGYDDASFEVPVLVGPSSIGGLRVGDLNGDGRPELLRLATNEVTIHWNRPGRSWKRTLIEADDAVLCDGDLFIRRETQLFRVPVVDESLGSPRLAATDSQLLESALISGGDLDGDGRDDLVSVRERSRILWLRRSGGFMRAYEFSSPYGSPAFAELNGGGHAELIGVNHQGLLVLWGEVKG